MITRNDERLRSGRGSQKLKSSFGSSGKIFQRVIVIFFLFLLVGGGGVFEYARKTGEREELATQRAEVEQKVKLQREKLTNARIVLESYKSGKYIFRRVREWSLDLHKPSRMQVTGVMPDGSRAPMPTWVRESIVVRNR